MSLWSVHLGYVLGHIPFASRFAEARRLGFSAVEFPFPYDIPAPHYARLLADNGLAQISIGARTTDYRKGEPGYAADAGKRDRFDATVSEAIEYALRIDCPAIHIFSGAPPPDTDRAHARAVFAENLARACEAASSAGLDLVIEPINSIEFPQYLIDRPSVARALAESVDGLGIILDLYHAYMMREDPLALLRDHAGLVSHLQLADHPGRHEPGSGGIDFAAVRSAVEAGGYAGSRGLEYIPTSPIEVDAAWWPLIDRLR